jgi:hypothetical protein
MPELGPYGSVRGAAGNSRPYREQSDVVAALTQHAHQRRAAVHPWASAQVEAVELALPKSKAVS